MTHKDELIAALQKLMKSDGIKRSKMGLVFEIYDTLLELRNSGVKAGDIETLLNDPAGVFNFALPTGSLTSYMHRIKLKKAAAASTDDKVERVERQRRVVKTLVEPTTPKTPKPRKPPTKQVVVPDEDPAAPKAVATPATAADVKKAFAEKKDFSRYNTD